LLFDVTLDLSGHLATLDRAEYHLDTFMAQPREAMELNAEPRKTRDHPINDSHSSIFDHVVALLVGDVGHPIHSKHPFPIVDAPHEWPRKVANPPRGWHRLLQFVDSAHNAVIEQMQSHQPTTGLASLAVLRDVSNADKHRLIHAVRRRWIARPKLSAMHLIPTSMTEVTYL